MICNGYDEERCINTCDHCGIHDKKYDCRVSTYCDIHNKRYICEPYGDNTHKQLSKEINKILEFEEI